MYIFKQRSSSKSNSCCVKEDKAKLRSAQFSINVRRRHNISRVNSRKAEDTVEGVRHGMPVKYVELGLFLRQGSVLLQQLFQEAKGRRHRRRFIWKTHKPRKNTGYWRRIYRQTLCQIPWLEFAQERMAFLIKFQWNSPATFHLYFLFNVAFDKVSSRYIGNCELVLNCYLEIVK